MGGVPAGGLRYAATTGARSTSGGNREARRTDAAARQKGGCRSGPQREAGGRRAVVRLDPGMEPRSDGRAHEAASAGAVAATVHQGALLGPGDALPAAALRGGAGVIRARIEGDDGPLRERRRHDVCRYYYALPVRPVPPPPALPPAPKPGVHAPMPIHRPTISVP